MDKSAVLRYTSRIPTLQEFVDLRTNARWPLPPRPMMAEALAKTLYGVCAETPDGKTVGMARVVGDGGIQLFITDVIVHTDWQNRGIGARLMQSVMEYVRANTSSATFVGLFSALGRDEFYRKFSFIVRPSDTLGPGMVYHRDSNRQI